MPDIQAKNIQIAKNTLLLYSRLFITIIVSLYTARIVLEQLGVEDYGIYNAVAGVVTIFSFLNGTLTSASQRFLSFELGRGNEKCFKDLFKVILFVHLVLSLIIVVIIEGAGVWFLLSKMNIPDNRIEAALIVLHCSTFTLLTRIVQVPFAAVIVAYEKMGIFAYLSIFDVLLKLVVAFSLYYYNGDKLELYAYLMTFSSIGYLLLSISYSLKLGIKIGVIVDKIKIKELLSFAGWNFFAHFALVARIQGITLLLNVFHGALLNAARAIAMQVSGMISNFMGNFQMAVNPQIVKRYSCGEMSSMYNLIYTSSKYNFFLMLLLIFPIIKNTETILNIWLDNVPEYSILFCQLSLISVLIDSLTSIIGYAALASGKIKTYQIVISSLFILNPILTYVFFVLGFPPEYAFYTEIFVYILVSFARLFLVRKITGISLRKYYEIVISNVLIVLFILIIIFEILPIWLNIESNKILLTFIIPSIIVLLFGLSKSEKQIIKKIIYLKLLNRNYNEK